jgi:putative toxin-antitoxin system antitoxin component (TIGR02293 family)
MTISLTYSLSGYRDTASVPDLFASQYFFKAPSDRVAEPSTYVEISMSFADTKPLFDYLGYSQHEVAELMEVDPSTLSRWKKEDKILTRLLTKSIMGMDKIVFKGVRIFGSESLFSDWLHTSNVSLGDRIPADMMRDPYGVELVEEALESMSWGNFM